MPEWYNQPQSIHTKKEFSMKLKYIGKKFSPIVVLIKRKKGGHFSMNVSENQEFEAPDDVAYKILSKYNSEEREIIVPVTEKASLEDAQARVSAAAATEKRAEKEAVVAEKAKDDEEL